uniref:Uncharacterized protein n=1 Tax=Tenebrio molitor TaxID=7067 RepID=A0A8J6H3S8_TENMO|nr:hypothetical protein GEV33_015191 [Tenebrio molitor]
MNYATRLRCNVFTRRVLVDADCWTTSHLVPPFSVVEETNNFYQRSRVAVPRELVLDIELAILDLVG